LGQADYCIESVPFIAKHIILQSKSIYFGDQNHIYCYPKKKAVRLIEPCDSIVIDRALNSGWRDFEDAVQNFSAEANPLITGIITRNQKDFRHSELKIVDSRLFLK